MVQDNKSPTPDMVKIIISVIPAPPTTVVSYSQQIVPVFNSRCTGCHGAEGNLTLAPEIGWSALVNIAAQSSCTSWIWVLPNDADNSVLYRKVAGTTCGTRMPVGGVLSPTEIGLIRMSINQGALDY